MHLHIGQSIGLPGGTLALGLDDLFGVDTRKPRTDGNPQRGQHSLGAAGIIFDRRGLVGNVDEHDAGREQHQRNDLSVLELFPQQDGRKGGCREELSLHEDTKDGGVEVGESNVFHRHLEGICCSGDG